MDFSVILYFDVEREQTNEIDKPRQHVSVLTRVNVSTKTAPWLERSRSFGPSFVTSSTPLAVDALLAQLEAHPAETDFFEDNEWEFDGGLKAFEKHC